MPDAGELRAGDALASANYHTKLVVSAQVSDLDNQVGLCRVHEDHSTVLERDALVPHVARDEHPPCAQRSRHLWELFGLLALETAPSRTLQHPRRLAHHPVQAALRDALERLRVLDAQLSGYVLQKHDS